MLIRLLGLLPEEPAEEAGLLDRLLVRRLGRSWSGSGLAGRWLLLGRAQGLAGNSLLRR